MKICDRNNEQRKPLLSNEKIQIVEHKGMGSEKWHTLLRAVGPHLAGQGGRPGFLNKAESFTVKTLTKETLGEVPLFWMARPTPRQQTKLLYYGLLKQTMGFDMESL